jgi:hypothetical protein
LIPRDALPKPLARPKLKNCFTSEEIDKFSWTIRSKTIAIISLRDIARYCPNLKVHDELSREGKGKENLPTFQDKCRLLEKEMGTYKGHERKKEKNGQSWQGFCST